MLNLRRGQLLSPQHHCAERIGIVDDVKSSASPSSPHTLCQNQHRILRKNQTNPFAHSHSIPEFNLKPTKLNTRRHREGKRYLRSAAVSQISNLSFPIVQPAIKSDRRTSLHSTWDILQDKAQHTHTKTFLNSHWRTKARIAKILHHKLVGLPKYKHQQLSTFYIRTVYRFYATHLKYDLISKGLDSWSTTIQSTQIMTSTASRKRKLDDDTTKYYAVKAGHSTGVFENWSDCQESITGFKGAVCK